MIKNLFFIVFGFTLAICLSTAYAKYEASNNDAAPVLGYGYNGTSLVAISVDSNGNPQ